MEKIQKYITKGGRIMYDNLKKYIDVTSMSEFAKEIEHPFLVGKELYEGEIKHANDDVAAEDTMKFNVASLRKELLDEQAKTRENFNFSIPEKKFTVSKTGISSAVFLFRKKEFSSTGANVFTIGRNSNNDIIIPDYSISKFHATITIFHNRYFVEDVNSTNGVKINEMTIRPNVKKQLVVNSSIAFGRISFFFSPQLTLYRALKTSR